MKRTSLTSRRPHATAGRFQSHLQPLEPRTLYAAVGDLNFLSDLTSDTTPVVTQSPDAYAPRSYEDGFRWYDGTPDYTLKTYTSNVYTMNVASWMLWPLASDGKHGDMSGENSEVRTRAVARTAAATTGAITIDLENWIVDIRLRSKDIVDYGLARVSKVIGWIRDEAPSVKIGVYGLVPLNDDSAVGYAAYDTSTNVANPLWSSTNAPGTSLTWAKYQNANAYLSALADQCDFMAPSLYASSNDIGKWKNYAQATIAEARRYGKPVVPYLWPMLHDGTATSGNTPASAEMWQAQLDTIPQLADGAVIWTAYQVSFQYSDTWVQQFLSAVNPGVGSVSAPQAPSTIDTTPTVETPVVDPVVVDPIDVVPAVEQLPPGRRRPVDSIFSEAAIAV